MRSIIFTVLFVAVCLAGILGGFYAYLGSVGTQQCRADSIARGEFLSDPSFSYKHHYLTKKDLEGVPEDIAEQYKDSARACYTLATQGNWDKLVIFGQSFLLVGAGAIGLLSLRHPNADD